MRLPGSPVMNQSSIGSCWAVPVDIVAFGARFEEYIMVDRAIQALRKCHIYGKGDRAAITRLPKELVDMIEDHLTQDHLTERSQIRESWSSTFTCHEARCSLISHFSDDELVGMWNKKVDYEYGRPLSGCCDFTLYAAESDLRSTEEGLSDEDRDALNKWLLEADLELESEQDRNFGVFGWRHRHEEQKEAWRRKVGKPGSWYDRDSYFLYENRNILEEDFGLQMWISSTQSRRRFSEQWLDEGVYRTTIAYLHRPYNFFHKEAWRMRSDEQWEEEEAPILDTDFGFGCIFKPPPPPSNQDVTAFKQAFDILGFNPFDKKPGSRPATRGASRDQLAQPQVHRAAPSRQIWPELLLLSRNSFAVPDAMPCRPIRHYPH